MVKLSVQKVSRALGGKLLLPAQCAFGFGAGYCKAGLLLLAGLRPVGARQRKRLCACCGIVLDSAKGYIYNKVGRGDVSVDMESVPAERQAPAAGTRCVF